MDTRRTVAIVGVTGFVGRALPSLLKSHGFSIIGISRSPNANVPEVDRWQTLDSLDFSGCEAVINLAGEPVDQRWTDETRRRFRESRIGITNRITESIAKLPEDERPNALINASAVGYYGDRADEILPESAHPGTGFLAELCADWEEAASDAETLGMRVVRLRIGIVLGKGGAAFDRLSSIFKLGIGGRLGNGRQWMPWVHVDDMRAIICHTLLNPSISGPLNACAPNPERNVDFTQKLAKAYRRPAFLPSPAFALRLILGEFSSALLASERVVPAQLEAERFAFQYPTLESALADLVQ